MSGPLTGFTVLDFTTSLSGPLAAVVFADLGADVVKVERPGLADRARFVGARRGDISSMFHMANRGKRAIELNLGQPADREVAVELASRVDLVVENFRPGVTKRLGIDYDSLSALNPNLVYLSISGFGPTGPYAHRPAFDSIIQAYSGLAAIQGGTSHGGEPALINHAAVDKLAGMIAGQAATAALLARERGRGGQLVEISMLDVAAWFMWLDAAGPSTILDATEGQHDDATTHKRVVIQYRDGWGMLSLGHDAGFRAVCEVFGVAPDAYPQLATLAGRDQNHEDYLLVLELIKAAASTMSRDDASARLDAAGAIFGEVLEPDEVSANEQLIAAELFVKSTHPTAGRIFEPRYPARYSVTDPTAPGPSPSIGQHTHDIVDPIRAALDGAVPESADPESPGEH